MPRAHLEGCIINGTGDTENASNNKRGVCGGDGSRVLAGIWLCEYALSQIPHPGLSVPNYEKVFCTLVPRALDPRTV